MSLIGDQFNLFIYLVSALAFVFSLVEVVRLFLFPKVGNQIFEFSSLFWRGVKVYLIRQLSIVAVVSVVVSSIIYQILSLESALGFLLGSLLSALVATIVFLVSNFTLFWCFAFSNRYHPMFSDLLVRATKFSSLFLYAIALGGLYSFYRYTQDPKALISLGLGVSWVALMSRVSGLFFSRGTRLNKELYGAKLLTLGRAAHSLGEQMANQFSGLMGFYELLSLGIVGSLLLGEKLNDLQQFSLFGFGVLALGLLAWTVSSFIRFRTTNIMRNFIMFHSLFLVFIFLTIKNFLRVSQPAIPTLEIAGLTILVFLATMTISHYYLNNRFAPFKKLSKFAQQSLVLGQLYILSLSRRANFAIMAMLVVLLLLASGSLGWLGLAMVVMIFLALSPMALFASSLAGLSTNAQNLAQEIKLPRKMQQDLEQLSASSSPLQLTARTFGLVTAILILLLFLTLIPFPYTQVLSTAVWGRLLVSALIGYFLVSLFSSSVLASISRHVSDVGALFSSRGRPSTKGLDELKHSYISRLLKDAYLQLIIPWVILIIGVGVIGFILGSRGLFGLILGMLIYAVVTLPPLLLSQPLSSHLQQNLPSGKVKGITSLDYSLEMSAYLMTDSLLVVKTSAITFLGILSLLFAYYLG